MRADKGKSFDDILRNRRLTFRSNVFISCALKPPVRGNTKMAKMADWLRQQNMELDEENIEDQKPRAPCTGLRKELKECILESDCVKKVIFNWIHTI